MSRRLWIALAVAVAVLAFGATTASAHWQRYHTDIGSVNFTFFDGSVEIEGRLFSSLARCERFRRVVAFAVEDQGTHDDGDDEFTFIDADFTNANGIFVLQGPVPDETDEIVIHLQRDVVGESGHRHVCTGDTATFGNLN